MTHRNRFTHDYSAVPEHYRVPKVFNIIEVFLEETEPGLYLVILYNKSSSIHVLLDWEDLPDWEDVSGYE